MIIVKKLCLAMALICVSSYSFAANIAVFGDNGILPFLNGNGHTATLVSDADLATNGFLDSFDIFLYTRDGASFGASLSPTAAANVTAFVSGQIVLFTSDMADVIAGNAEAETLLLNAVAFSEAGGGFIGEFNGSCAAMASNSQSIEPLGLVEGSCDQLSSGQGGDPHDIIQNDHPVVQGVSDPFNLGGGGQFYALVSTDPEFIIAVNSSQIPAIVAGEGSVARGPSIPIPTLSGLGLVLLSLMVLFVASRRLITI